MVSRGQEEALVPRKEFKSKSKQHVLIHTAQRPLCSREWRVLLFLHMGWFWSRATILESWPATKARKGKEGQKGERRKYQEEKEFVWEVGF